MSEPSIYASEVDDYYDTPTCRISLRTALSMCSTDYDRGRVIAEYAQYVARKAVEEERRKNENNR